MEDDGDAALKAAVGRSMATVALARVATIFACLVICATDDGAVADGPAGTMARFLLFSAWFADIVIPDDVRPGWMDGSTAMLPGAWAFRAAVASAMQSVMALCALLRPSQGGGMSPWTLAGVAVLVAAAIVSAGSASMVRGHAGGPPTPDGGAR